MLASSRIPPSCWLAFQIYSVWQRCIFHSSILLMLPLKMWVWTFIVDDIIIKIILLILLGNWKKSSVLAHLCDWHYKHVCSYNLWICIRLSKCRFLVSEQLLLSFMLNFCWNYSIVHELYELYHHGLLLRSGNRYVNYFCSIFFKHTTFLYSWIHLIDFHHPRRSSRSWEIDKCLWIAHSFPRCCW